MAERIGDERSAHGTCFVAPTMMGRSRTAHARALAWAGLAMLVHALLLAGVALLPVRRGAVGRGAEVPAAAAEVEAEIAISIEEGVAPEAEPAKAEAEAKASASAKANASASAKASANAKASADANESGAALPVAPAPGGAEGRGVPGTASSGIVVAVPYSAAELGIGGANPLLPRHEEKMPAAGPDHPAARAMRGTGLARDRELGLGPEGPAITALSEATTSSLAPLRGRAMFVVRTGGDGVVSSIDLIDSDGGSGWLDAGRIALESLRGKKLRIPSGAAGMNMHIEVRSEMKLPNGENAPVGGRLGENNMPELTIPDVSNIGAKPRRVIHARAAGTELL